MSTNLIHHNAWRTHCIHGHEFTPENTFWKKQSKGGKMRVCRACKTRRDTERRRELGHEPFQPAQHRNVTREELRRLVDVVWNEATESTAVPSTKWADRLITKAFPDFP